MGSALKDSGGGYNWQKIVKRTLANTPPICQICGEGDLTHLGSKYRWSVDHIVSRADFGTGNADVSWNLQRVHLVCNSRKSARRTQAKRQAKKQGKTLATAIHYAMSKRVTRQERA